jgi:hypothetical protein
MEYVDGLPIDRYCDLHHLDVPARICLFKEVCGAVAFAHRQGIVHRDLKPANIFVTSEGQVKLLDFGIATIVRGSRAEPLLTGGDWRVFTPQYASPEQLSGFSLSAATDIYSLGVILYELLTGHRPYRLQGRLLHELLRAICEEDPTRPSVVVGDSAEIATAVPAPRGVTPESISWLRSSTTQELARRLRGDLDNILLKALSKSPHSRYSSAEQLADDLNRHLSGLPILARERTPLYGITRFIRRNKATVGVVVIVLCLFVTRSIRLEQSGMLFVVALVSVLGLGYLALRADTGDQQAARTLAVDSPRLIGLALIALLLNRLFPVSVMEAAVVAVYLFGLLLLCFVIPQCLAPKFWSGQLLLDLSRPAPKFSRLLRPFLIVGAFGQIAGLSIALFTTKPQLSAFPIAKHAVAAGWFYSPFGSCPSAIV